MSRKILFAVGLVLSSGLAWGADIVGPIEVALLPLPTRSAPGAGTCHGYVEVRVKLKNTSAKDQTVRLSFPPEEMRSGPVRYGAVVTRTVSVAPGQEVGVSLYQPPVPALGNELEVRVDGVEERRILALSSLFVEHYRSYSPYGGSSSANPQRAILLSRAVPQDFRDFVERKTKEVAESNARLMGRELGATPAEASMLPEEVFAAAAAMTAPELDPDKCSFLRSELPVGQWSANWLGYSCYDAIVLGQEEAESMPLPVQLAIRRYVECGGVVVVQGRKLPAAFSEGGAADREEDYSVGFGRAAASLTDDKSNWSGVYERLAALWPQGFSPRHYFTDAGSLLVKSATVPVRAMFIILVLFAAGVGPLNVWLLSRYKRRIWLWWDVPAISLATCLAVFLYALFSEGWRSYGKVASLTVLDERCHRAATIGYLSYYCPLTPSRGLRFGSDTEVAPVSQWSAAAPYDYQTYASSLRFVDWTSDQRLGAGWISARVPAYFEIRKNEDRRQRLNVRKGADGSLVAVNALGADIRRLYLADAAGRVFEGRGIRAGAEGKLSPVPGAVVAAKKSDGDLRKVFSAQNWLEPMSALGQSGGPPNILARGSYLALLDKSPFLESPLVGTDSRDTLAVVYGICKGEDDGR